MKRLPFVGLAFSMLSMIAASTLPARAAQLPVYIGTYTGPKSQGIYLSRFDTRTGVLSPPVLAAEARNPTFLALHPNRKWLYAVGEVGNYGGQRSGSLSAFRIEPSSGKLSLLNEQPSGGSGPCHLAVDHTGKCLLVANYGSGSVAALALEADGRLKPPSCSIQHQGSSVDRQRQSGPHAHFITPDPRNRFALACDLGLDKVLVYRLNPTEGLLTANQPPSVSTKAGGGPRHLAFHPNGRWVYLLQEMSADMTVLEYAVKAGELRELQTVSTLPVEFKGQKSAAEVQVHPSGRFVYCSNRGADSITVFKSDPATGKLTAVDWTPTRGKTPRHFTLTPNGDWLLSENQDSNNVVVFKVDVKTGRLMPNGQSIGVGAPVCAVFGAKD